MKEEEEELDLTINQEEEDIETILAEEEEDDDEELEEEEGRSSMMNILLFLMLITVFIFSFWDRMFINIPAGHMGVMFYTFGGGTVVDRHWNEGIAFVFPWDQIFIYDTRVISNQDTVDGLTNDGVTVLAEVSYRFRPEIDSLGLMHKKLGLDYSDKIIVPLVTSAARRIFSNYGIEALYEEKRVNVERQILDEVHKQVDAFYPITTIDLVLRSVELDSLVGQAISNKLVKEQEYLAYQYIIKKEEEEEKRKLIEAKGIRYFRDTSGLTDNESLLKYYGLMATEKLATSPNSKVVIVGTDSKELPVILGGN